MEHTECKDCELSNGDCGYHFKMDGVTNYDIPSLSACDQYGNCEFFKPKAKSKGDLISREALKKTLKSNCKPELCHDYGTNWCEACCPHNDFEDLIDNAPTIPIQRDVWELYKRYQPRLATNVYEFGVELKELLGRYEKGGKE